MYQKLIVIGLNDNYLQPLQPEVLQFIQEGSIFSGSPLHRRLVEHLLPASAKWIDIATPPEEAYCAYQSYAQVIIFASGDPLFSGFASILKETIPEADIRIYPYFTPLQQLAHRLLLPYHDMRNVSLASCTWDEFDRALIERTEKIGILPDNEHTPAIIASRMLEYNYHPYTMYVAEYLGHPDKEQIHHLTLQTAAEKTFEHPDSVILISEGKLLPRHFGIPENKIECLKGPTKAPTKAPIRLMTLNQLKLDQRTSFWDIGSWTGSVSIEAKLQFPHLKVTAFEIKPEGQRLMNTNSRRFGVPGITQVIGDFMKLDLYAYPAPDAVFIDGHNNKLKEMLLFISEVLLPGGIIVMNCIKPEDKKLFIEGAADAGLEVLPIIRFALHYYSLIEVVKAVAPLE